jgi:transposase
VTYLSQYQLLPVNRVKQLIQDIHGVSLSSGTIQNFIRRLAQKLEPAVQKIQESLLDQAVCHFDESGLRVNGKLYWLHTAATPKLTWFGLHKKRGSEAMNEHNILPRYKGVAVHDGWVSYRNYECTHALCNAHHLRELTFIQETTHQIWPAKMKALLLNGLKEKNTLTDHQLDPVRIKDYNTHYLEILDEGDSKNPLNAQNGKRGRIKQTDAVNLLRRLREYRPDVLRFLSDPVVPFTNNEAERAIRMPKLKQKVSGCMRTEQGAKDFCIIRSYMATCKKQAIDLISSLISVWHINIL